eukprot:2008656-Rhodomonas_salina.3
MQEEQEGEKGRKRGKVKTEGDADGAVLKKVTQSTSETRALHGNASAQMQDINRARTSVWEGRLGQTQWEGRHTKSYTVQVLLRLTFLQLPSL